MPTGIEVHYNNTRCEFTCQHITCEFQCLSHASARLLERDAAGLNPVHHLALFAVKNVVAQQLCKCAQLARLVLQSVCVWLQAECTDLTSPGVPWLSMWSNVWQWGQWCSETLVSGLDSTSNLSIVCDVVGATSQNWRETNLNAWCTPWLHPSIRNGRNLELCTKISQVRSIYFSCRHLLHYWYRREGRQLTRRTKSCKQSDCAKCKHTKDLHRTNACQNNTV